MKISQHNILCFVAHSHSLFRCERIRNWALIYSTYLTAKANLIATLTKTQRWNVVEAKIKYDADAVQVALIKYIADVQREKSNCDPLSIQVLLYFMTYFRTVSKQDIRYAGGYNKFIVHFLIDFYNFPTDMNTFCRFYL